MKVDTKALRAELVLNDFTQETFADEIGVDKSTLNRYMNAGCQTIPIGIIHRMVRVLNMSNSKAIDIFFAASVAKTQQK